MNDEEIKARNLVIAILAKTFGQEFGQFIALKFHMRDQSKRKNTYFGLSALDQKLEKYLDYDNGFYVELGANDGFSQSNTLYYELNRGWKGVLIEPAPHNFLTCQNLRAKNNAVHCNACVSFDYSEQFVEMVYANLMSVGKGTSTDLENVDAHIAAAQAHMPAGQTTFTFGAVAKTLTKILDESQAPRKIDLLSLDVEGAELEVLQGIDFNKYRFKYMLVECRDIDRLRAFLTSVKYQVVDQLTERDYLFSPDP